MAFGLSQTLSSMGNIVAVMHAAPPAPEPRVRAKKATSAGQRTDVR